MGTGHGKGVRQAGYDKGVGQAGRGEDVEHMGHSKGGHARQEMFRDMQDAA